MTEAQLSICKTCLNRKKGEFAEQDICNIRGLKLQPEEVCSYFEADKKVVTSFEEKKSLIRPNATRAQYAIIGVVAVMTLDIISGISSYMQLHLLDKIKSGVTLSEDAYSANDFREQTIGYIYTAVLIISTVLFIQWFRRAYYNLQVRTGNCEHSDGWAAGSWFVPIICLFRPYRMMLELTEKTSSLLNVASGKDVKTNTRSIGIWWTLWIITNYLGNYVLKSAFRGETLDNLTDTTVLEMVNSALGIPLAIITVYIIKTYAAKETALALEESNTSF